MSQRRAATKTAEPERRFPVAIVLGIVFAVALIVTVVLTMDSGTSEFGTVEIEGAALSVFPGDTGTDPALGAAAPAAFGQEFNGDDIAITPDGRPKIVVFLAHWCPVCQQEVPMLVDWIEAGGQPDNIDVIAVATATRSTSDNYPPSAWLDREGLDVPTLVDDESATTAAAYGLSAFPFWVFLDGEGVVNARFQGIIPPSELSRLAFSLLP